MTHQDILTEIRADLSILKENLALTVMDYPALNIAIIEIPRRPIQLLLKKERSIIKYI